MATRDENEPRRGVRTPIVLAVLLGLGAVGAVVYVKKDDISVGGKGGSSGASFSELCNGMKPGTAAFDARQILVGAAMENPKMQRPPDVTVQGQQMQVKFKDPATGGRVWTICNLQLDKSGKAVTVGRSATQPAAR